MDYYIQRLKNDCEITEEINPNYLLRNWPPAFSYWSLKDLRDVFYSSPKFPRILHSDGLKNTIINGISNSLFALAQKQGNDIKEVIIGKTIAKGEFELSDEFVILSSDEAKRLQEPPKLQKLEIILPSMNLKIGQEYQLNVKGYDQYSQIYSPIHLKWTTSFGTLIDNRLIFEEPTNDPILISAFADDISVQKTVYVEHTKLVHNQSTNQSLSNTTNFTWNGIIPLAKWVLFYSKILLKLTQKPKLSIHVRISCEIEKENVEQLKSEVRPMLIELGLEDSID